MLFAERIIIGVFIVMLLPAVCGPLAHGGVATTRHNLSVSGPGPVKAVSEERICVFCHTPHNGMTNVAGIGIPLWNHTLSTAAYQLYTSPTLLSPTSPSIQPDGSTRLCLSCHDGTVAVGSVIVGNSISMVGTGGGGEMPAGPSNYGTDLSGNHPVSIEINNTLISDKAQQCSDGIVAFKVCRPPAGSPVKLSKTNNRYGGAVSGTGVQCTSCHDPHEDPLPGTTIFLRAGDRNSHDQLCEACHISDCLAACP